MENSLSSRLPMVAAPIGRVFIAAIFLLSGVTKISAYAGTQAYMDAMGVPGAMLPLVIVFEVLGALAIIVGYQTRLAAFALAGFSVLTALLFHFNFADQAQSTSFMKNIAIAGGFLLLVAHGAGAYSIDKRLSEK